MKKSEFKKQIREEAKRKVRGPQGGVAAERAYRDRIEQGRTQLMRKSAEGGDTNAKKIKNELTYLLNNYTPRFDMRIEQLIEAWRTSHDPSYDPGIKAKFRKVRREQMQKSNPF
jgi:hypothetical protein